VIAVDTSAENQTQRQIPSCGLCSVLGHLRGLDARGWSNDVRRVGKGNGRTMPNHVYVILPYRPAHNSNTSWMQSWRGTFRKFFFLKR
jgi:hypothetical protein